MKRILWIAVCFFSISSLAKSPKGDFLVKLKPGSVLEVDSILDSRFKLNHGESIDESWTRLQFENQLMSEEESSQILRKLRNHPAVEYAQPNYILHVLGKPSLKAKPAEEPAGFSLFTDLAKPGIPTPPPVRAGTDPMIDRQWGMKAIHAPEAWAKFKGSREIIVGVIDTGVDYTHEDLIQNMWINTKEIPGNGIDDDGNGYVDDIVGWDFAENDNRPYDVHTDDPWKIMQGINPGHGTHCAGNVGATGDNGLGISGAAPLVSIMALRFITEKDEGLTSSAIKAINYGVNNGARILSNSWGSEGEEDDPKEPGANLALRESIQNAMKKNVLFIAAAGNGHMGQGYDNDTDKKPTYPASYDIPNIISVAAMNSRGELASFSNWGRKTVHVGAPGVGVFSTTVNNKYSDVVIATQGQTIGWDGTSMAAPHVAGAAALIWTKHPEYTWLDVKNKLISTVTPLPSLNGRSVSGGMINLEKALE